MHFDGVYVSQQSSRRSGITKKWCTNVPQGWGILVYEDYLGLSKRPFSSFPNADCYVPVLPAQEALDSLVHCVTQARGIGVITSAPGLGKTQLCKQLAANLNQDFLTVYLSTSGFHTRRALLQSMLYELGINYVGLSEQEARLRIFEAANAAQKDGRYLLIIADEAHLLNNRLFEELRALGDYAPDGVSLIRLVLSGEFELEEKLADPAMSAFNQRVGTQVCLYPLSLEQSAQFVIERLQWAGAKEIQDILTEDALEAICRASDGNPRCLCQLADHCCLLSYAEEQKPITRGIVLAALNDVKELPLTWSEVGESTSTQAALVDSANETNFEDEDDDMFDSLDEHVDLADSKIDISLQDTEEFEIPNLIASEPKTENVSMNHTDHQTQTEASEAVEVKFAVLEVGNSVHEISSKTEPQQLHESKADLAMQNKHESQAATKHSVKQEMTVDQMIERAVYDRYAFLDRMAQLPVEIREEIKILMPQATNVRLRMTSMGEICLDSDDDCDLENELLKSIENIRAEIINPMHTSETNWDDEDVVLTDLDEWTEYDVVQPAGHYDDLETEIYAFEKHVDFRGNQDNSHNTASAVNLLQEAKAVTEEVVNELVTPEEVAIWDQECDAVETHAEEVEELTSSLSISSCCEDEHCNGVCGETGICDLHTASIDTDVCEHTNAEECFVSAIKDVVSEEAIEAINADEYGNDTVISSEVFAIKNSQPTQDTPKERRFEQLFTRLRLRRRKAQERAAG